MILGTTHMYEAHGSLGGSVNPHLGFCMALSGETPQINQRPGAVLLATFLGMDRTRTCLPLGASTLSYSIGGFRPLVHGGICPHTSTRGFEEKRWRG